MDKYDFKHNMLVGVHIGEHGFNAEKVIDEINERVVKPGYNFVTIRTRARAGEFLPQETYLKWAKYLADNKIYFIFLYSINTRTGKLISSIDVETVKAMSDIAGEYFLGDMVGELGSCFGAKSKGYGATGNRFIVPGQDHPDVKSAADAFVGIVGEYTALDRELAMPYISSVEPTMLAKYIDMGGVDLPMVELACGNADLMLPYIRGMARAFGRHFGTYLAHEWYGGMRHSDTLKRKRLTILNKLAYLSGSEVFCIESGDELVTAYGERHEFDSPISEDYRRNLGELLELSKTDFRHKDGPRVKFAFVSGRYDAHSGWGGSSVFGQYEREEWGYSSAEHSYNLLGDLAGKRSWSDIHNYGDSDLSASPAYGQYDIVPIEADVDAFKKYDYLVFLGWNTMTDEDMDKLIEYVECGGTLLMTAAHLNYSVKRSGEYIAPPHEKMIRLFGADFTGEVVRTNNGFKFVRDSGLDGYLYPGASSNMIDPILGTGYVDYAVTELHGATVGGYIADGFTRNTREFPPVLLEHKLGRGFAMLATAREYPGAPAVYPLYRMLVRELVTLSHRNCEIKVTASDRLRYSVYEDGKIYLLNTDYDLPISVKIEYQGMVELLTLNSLELRIIDLNNIG